MSGAAIKLGLRGPLRKQITRSHYIAGGKASGALSTLQVEGTNGPLYLARLSMFLGRTRSHAAVSTRIVGYKDVSWR